jgi:ABC-2 type transport system permease protein
VNNALWLLIGLQMGGWLRYLGRSLRTVKGVLLALVGVAVFLPWLLSPLLIGARSEVPPEQVRLFGPAVLVLYCFLNVLASSGERTIYFTPAEVAFLFPGPFSRREVLGYKIASSLLIGLPMALLMSIFLHIYARWFPAAFVGLLLIYVFMQLFSMALSLVATSVGARLYTRGRKVVLGVLVLFGLGALAQAGVFAPGTEPRELFAEVAQTPVWQTATLPLRWFFDAFLAERLWPDLAVSALLALVVDMALLGVVLLLDTQYLETAAAASARVYARIQRMRRAGLAGDAPSAGGIVRLSLPDFPWWGGIGPTLWRQLTTAMRGLGRLAVVLGILGVILAPVLRSAPGEEGQAVPTAVVSMLVWLTVFLTALVPFDFRGDLDRMAFLKTLPLPAWRLAVGQLLTPVLFFTLMQWLILVAALYLTSVSAFWVGVLAVYLPPVNFLLFALENLLFLLFPTRLSAATPGDFQSLGRNVLFWLAKLAGMFLVTVVAVVVGAVVYLVTDGNLPAACAAAWPVVALSGAALVPLVALAFRAFDVGRDTPA